MTETARAGAARTAKAKGLSIERIYTTPGVHPYDEVTWERRDVNQTNWKTGAVIFDQRGVEFPEFWSVNASTIVTTKYFRGAVGTPERESSLRQLIDRVVLTYVKAGRDFGYFTSPADAEIFEHELTYALLHQVFSFNSPVWFNVGTPSPQQVSACQPYHALVSTPAGLVPIGKLVEDNLVGTKVYDAHGLTTVRAVKANGLKEVLRLTTSGGHQLEVTADHLVWKSTGEGVGCFVDAGTLAVGDQLEWHGRVSTGESEITGRDIAEAALAGSRGLDDAVPAHLFEAPMPVVAAYLRSLFQAAGVVTAGARSAAIEVNLPNELLIRGLQSLLHRFGIFASVGDAAAGATDSPAVLRLAIANAGDRRTFADEIGFLDPVKAEDLERSLTLAGEAAAPVKRVAIVAVESLGVMEVYDIQTESGEYLSNSLRVHNCFILSVDDSMDSILNWYREEGFIFKGGSGAGLNLSRIRSSKELLSSGGTASGPVSFMRGADASAGTIKSGGATRRAAKMVVLDVDHPDIEEFISTKAREEDKIRALRDAGFDMDLGGKDIVSVQYQNANNSVRVNDEFMTAVEAGTSFGLRGRKDGTVIETVDARELFGKIATAAWECADPGLQYDDTINDWHTNPETGRITASNPCSEYMSLDNSSCNLASLNLLKFLRDDGTFDAAKFQSVVELVITAMDISICFADFPTESIGKTTVDYRQLGIGYANLGALLMATGHGYDSDGGRALAASITSLLTGAAYKRSAEMAGVVGPYAGYARNADAHKRVMRKHQAANDVLRTRHAMDDDIHRYATKAWDAVVKIGERNGYRNAQASVLAPTGTIGFMMDCDTTGIEPDFSLVKFKKLVGGGSMQIVNLTIPRALRKLGYAEETVEAIVEYIADKGHVVDAPGLKQEHYDIFDTAMGERAIPPMGHVRMMAAVQPFLSGAISKTVNLPESATVEEIENVYLQGWKLGLKALAVYRDNCKVGQPLSDGGSTAKDAAADKAAVAAAPAVVEKVVYRPTRERLPKRRSSETISFTVGGAEGYLTAGTYDDGRLGELFLKFGKQGSTLAGVMDAFSIAISVALQYGVPLETYVEKFTNMRFEPAGITDDPDVRMAQSLMDYVFRRLALDYMEFDTRSFMGIHTAQERAHQLETGSYAMSVDGESDEEIEDEIESFSQGVGAATKRIDRVDEAEHKLDATQFHSGAGAASAREVSGEIHSSQDLLAKFHGKTADAPMCMTCGTKMRPAGSCYVCEGCGSTSGCS